MAIDKGPTIAIKWLKGRITTVLIKLAYTSCRSQSAKPPQKKEKKPGGETTASISSKNTGGKNAHYSGHTVKRCWYLLSEAISASVSLRLSAGPSVWSADQLQQHPRRSASSRPANLQPRSGERGRLQGLWEVSLLNRVINACVC